MINLIYVITWRYPDGSGSGAVSAHFQQAEADQVLALLEKFGEREFKVEAVPCGPLP